MTKKDDAKKATSDPSAVAKKQDDSAFVVALQKEIATLQAELARFRDLAGRAQADLQNAKARVERESDDLRRFASEQMIRRMLPTLDNFQRAFQHVPAELESHEWVRGVAAIEQELMRVMADAGLTRMSSLNQPVDASRHEILSVGDGPTDVVVEVFEEGYEMNGKVLRPAKVKVGGGTMVA